MENVDGYVVSKKEKNKILSIMQGDSKDCNKVIVVDFNDGKVVCEFIPDYLTQKMTINYKYEGNKYNNRIVRRFINNNFNVIMRDLNIPLSK